MTADVGAAPGASTREVGGSLTGTQQEGMECQAEAAGTRLDEEGGLSFPSEDGQGSSLAAWESGGDTLVRVARSQGDLCPNAGRAGVGGPREVIWG